ncbi:hypothetical protein H4R21_004542 [Coemansia helicoidea]|uniref:Uncharacterized protein n=1 Tax=Coemansia helicoidea TaxID=1286919 RepID=A0ACC1KXP0_9FUNG|nr:hypothetical protein H4R21_004542 [Coemansia helicoidea]
MLGLVIVLLLFQFFCSLAETGLYAGEKVYMDNNAILYTKGWLYNFKWAVKPLSAVISLGLVVPALCSCCRPNTSQGCGTGGKIFPSVLAFFSLAMAILWAIIVGFQERNNEHNTVGFLINSSTAGGQLIYPLGYGFSLKNDCDAPLFAQVDFGTTACTILKADSAIAVVCLAVWGVLLLLSLTLFCGRARAPKTVV